MRITVTHDSASDNTDAVDARAVSMSPLHPLSTPVTPSVRIEFVRFHNADIAFGIAVDAAAKRSPIQVMTNIACIFLPPPETSSIYDEDA